MSHCWYSAHRLARHPGVPFWRTPEFQHFLEHPRSLLASMQLGLPCVVIGAFFMFPGVEALLHGRYQAGMVLMAVALGIAVGVPAASAYGEWHAWRYDPEIAPIKPKKPRKPKAKKS